MNIKANLYQLAKDKRISLRHLSKLTGISVSDLYAIQNDEKIPRVDTVYRIAHALGCEVNELFTVTFKS